MLYWSKLVYPTSIIKGIKCVLWLRVPPIQYYELNNNERVIDNREFVPDPGTDRKSKTSRSWIVSWTVYYPQGKLVDKLPNYLGSLYKLPIIEVVYNLVSFRNDRNQKNENFIHEKVIRNDGDINIWTNHNCPTYEHHTFFSIYTTD